VQGLAGIKQPHIMVMHSLLASGGGRIQVTRPWLGKTDVLIGQGRRPQFTPAV
jgi:hypothetical protein